MIESHENQSSSRTDRRPQESRPTAELKEDLEGLKENARLRVRKGKHDAADLVDAIARALHSAARELDAERHPSAARYTERAAEGMVHMSHNLRDKSVERLVHDGEELARRQPAICFGAAMIGGFALARFLKSSSSATTSESGETILERRAEASPNPRPETRTSLHSDPGTRPHQEGDSSWTE